MTFKIVAPALATMLLAGTAYAQTPSPAPEPECAVGDLNCPTPAPMMQDEAAPMDSGRSATEGTPGIDERSQGTPAERNSPAAQQVNPMIEPNDQDSSNSGDGSGSSQ